MTNLEELARKEALNIWKKCYSIVDRDGEAFEDDIEIVVLEIGKTLQQIRLEALEEYKYKRDNILLNEIRNEQFKLGVNHGLEKAAKCKNEKCYCGNKSIINYCNVCLTKIALHEDEYESLKAENIGLKKALFYANTDFIHLKSEMDNLKKQLEESEKSHTAKQRVRLFDKIHSLEAEIKKLRKKNSNSHPRY